MKKIIYHDQKTTIKIGETEFEAGIKEISYELITQPGEIEFIRFPARDNLQVSFKTHLNFDAKLSKFIEINPYRKVTMEFNGYISEQQKKMFGELEEKGFIWFVQFKQKIYPKLIAEISFITVFQVSEEI